MAHVRRKPNSLSTGTPGDDDELAAGGRGGAPPRQRQRLVKEKNLHDGWDEEFQCHVINDDLVCDELENMMEEGSNIVEYHGCNFFPEQWFDCVVVLQTNNSILYDRSASRGYMGARLSHNIECENFQVLLEEARSSYSEDIAMELQSNSVEDVSRNVATLVDWMKNWCPRSLPSSTKLSKIIPTCCTGLFHTESSPTPPTNREECCSASKFMRRLATSNIDSFKSHIVLLKSLADAGEIDMATKHIEWIRDGSCLKLGAISCELVALLSFSLKPEAILQLLQEMMKRGLASAIDPWINICRESFSW